MRTLKGAVGRGTRSERGRAMAKQVLTTTATSCVAVAAVLLAMVPRVEAQLVASDRTAGYIVFPHVEIDQLGQFSPGREVDTTFQLTNTATSGCRIVHCFYVDATKHCANNPSVACRTNADCGGGSCGIFTGSAPDCRYVRNFWLSLSAGQAVGWSAANGGQMPVDPHCYRSDLSTIPPVGADVMIGELKCVEVENSEVDGRPINANDLKGEATISEVAFGSPGFVDVRSYNAVGFPTVATDGAPQTQGAVCLGATTSGSPPAPAPGAVCGVATNAACPSTIVMNHWFDFAPGVGTGDPVRTNLILAPCSEDLNILGPGMSPATTIQFLIYNEFEQRFSASTSLSCLRKMQLSQIDTSPGGELFSIFSVNVQGTFTGQTRIRPVLGSELDKGHGVIGLMEEWYGSSSGSQVTLFGSSEANLAYTVPITGKADVVKLPSY